LKLERMGDIGMFAKVGRGGLVNYGWADCCRIVLAMELTATGTTIAECARSFASDWKTFDRFCKRADAASTDRTADVFLYVIRRASDPPGSPPQVVDMPAAELGKLWSAWLSGGENAPRFVATNLSRQLRRMREALEATPPRLRGRPRKNATVGKPVSAGGRERALGDGL
jgi:hypothetical protein